MSWHTRLGNDLVLYLEVKPGSRNDVVDGIRADRLRVRIKAPPVDGKANNQLLKFIAGEFGVPKSNVEITRGITGKVKTLVIHRPAAYPDWFEILC